MKEGVKRLWGLCFDDSRAFVDLYFDLKYSDEFNICIKEDGEVVSALQMLPYSMTYCGTEIETAYISGACTHPDYRGRGMMGVLLSRAFARMYAEGVRVSALIPASPYLFSYYGGMGYASVFQYCRRIVGLTEIVPSDDVRVEELSDFRVDFYRYLNRKMHERSCCIQHTEKDFRVVSADLFLEKGALFFASRDRQIVGAGVAKLKGGEICFIDLFADSREIADELVRQAAIKKNCSRICVIVPFEKTLEGTRLGMGRIIDAKNVLGRFAAAHPGMELNIKLSDSMLPVNNGYYYLRGGECSGSRSKLGVGVCRSLSVNELTEMIFTPLHPYMSLMLN